MADKSADGVNTDRPTRVIPRDSSAGITRAVRQDAAASSIANPRFALGVLPEGTLLANRYRVISTFRAHETARPGVYLCADGDQKVVVKVHPLDFPPPADVWTLIGRLKHPNVVPSINQQVVDGLYFDVQPYYPDGSLADVYAHSDTGLLKVDHDTITFQCAPQMLKALQYVHAAGLVHRDIKPSNILVSGTPSDRQFLLGDFDISSQLTVQNDNRVTSRAAGTWTYTAPEAFPRYQDQQGVVGAKVSWASDYYSLGVAMLEMACGTTPLHTCKLPDIYDFYLSGQRIDIPYDLPQRLRVLLQGLLIRNSAQRWGRDQLDRWMRNCNTDEDMELIRGSQREGGPAIPSYVYGAVNVQSVEQLGQLMADDLDAAASHIQHADELWAWLSKVDINLAVQIRKRVESAQHGGGEVILACLCNRKAVVTMGKQQVSSIDDWMNVFRQRYGSVIHDFEFYRFIYWLCYHANGDQQMARRMMPVAKTAPEIRMSEIIWAHNPEMPLVISPGYEAHTPEQFAAFAYGTEANWKDGVYRQYDLAMEIWQSGMLDAWLRQTKHPQIVQKSLELQQSKEAATYIEFEKLLHFMNPSLSKPEVKFQTPKEVVAEFRSEAQISIPYTTHGPGIPVIQVTWPSFPGLVAKHTFYAERVGSIVASLNVTQGLPTDTGYITLGVQSSNAVFDSGKIQVPYHITAPNGSIATQMAISVIIGAVACFMGRMVISAFGFAGAQQASVTGYYRHSQYEARIALGIFVLILGVCVLIFQSARSRVESVPLPMQNLDIDDIELGGGYGYGYGYGYGHRTELSCLRVLFARYPWLGLGLVFAYLGPYAICLLDWLTGASLLSSEPQIMWGLWGALLGAVAGFWLISPIRGWNHLRAMVTGGYAVVLVLWGFFINLLIHP